MDDPAFVENVHVEAAQNIRRIRHRACLALWCGNNEMEWGWESWGWAKQDWEDELGPYIEKIPALAALNRQVKNRRLLPDWRQLRDAYDKFFHRTLPGWVATDDPDHAYWPSSPSSETPFQLRSMHIDGPWFKDEHGRTLILRGANLGGSTKVPYRPDGATYIREGFFDHRDVSFVGRPFPLDEADEHFARLRAWGMTFLRFLITWEAIEHAGPGQYDEEYLDYVYRVIKKAGEYGIDVFIDPHQDVWSRFTGGDGAPGWTLEAVGMDITRMSETGAAIVHAHPRRSVPAHDLADELRQARRGDHVHALLCGE